MAKGPKIHHVPLKKKAVQDTCAAMAGINDVLEAHGRKFLLSITQGPNRIINLCQLSVKTGIHQSNLYEVANGARTLNPAMYVKIIEFLDDYGTTMTAVERQQARKAAQK